VGRQPQGRRGTQGDHRHLAPFQDRHQARFQEADRGHNIAEFTLEPKGDATNVTWAMHGPTAFIAKVMSLFCSMDKMIGKEFETGLAELKRIAENQA
jgi:hypothetical protein